MGGIVLRLPASLRSPRYVDVYPPHRIFLGVLGTRHVLDAGYQMVREGDDPEDRAEWAYPLGRWLIIYYCINAGLRMVSVGVRQYLGNWR